ncbi:MAG: ATP synthase F1 subunit epsilon [Magnetococcales bacterium]|nr:ATP synthase F1 subunit epsilon [Magnetococcales bacterium]
MSVILKVEVATPEKLLLSVESQFVVAPGEAGDIGVLPGHTPLMTLLRAGELQIGDEDEAQRFAVSGGFAEVLPDRVTLLVDEALPLADIDQEKSIRQLQDAMEKISGLNDELPEYHVQLRRIAFAEACIALLKKMSGSKGH